jgi:hypothetical protein
MEAVQTHEFEAVAEEPAFPVWAGRIRLHSAPGQAADHLTDVGYFLLDGGSETEGEPPIRCFVRREYRSSRRAIAEAVRGGALAASLPPGAVTADVRLRFYWTTPETDREAGGVGAPAADALAVGPAQATEPFRDAGTRLHVSYVPDTDERVPLEARSAWRAAGPAVMGKTLAGLVFVAGVALIAGAMPHFMGVTGTERPPSAIPDLVLGGALLVFALAFLVTERSWLMLLAGGVLCMFAGGHTLISATVGPMEIATALLGLLAGTAAVFLRRPPRLADAGEARVQA